MPLPDDPGVPTAQALEAYFEYALNGIIEATAEGRVVRGNPAAASILGRSRRRLDGASLDALLAHDDESRGRLQRHRETIAEQGVSLTTLQVAIDGAPRTIELASIDVGEGRHLHILDDITGQRQLTESLETARRAAEEANAAKSAFLANMSHEIRTPLNGIIGMERLLRLTPLTAQQAEYLDDLRRAARVLLALLGDVLDLSKIEAGRFELEPRAFDADEFLETVATACAPAAADKPIRVVFDIDPGVPWHWHGDPLRLAQAVNNLLANAIKFTPSGHVVLALSWTPGSDSRGRLRLAVRDTGIGMSAEQLERVFSPFVQADPSVTRRFGGTGLGLAIARGIVERMGGELTATSRPAAGSEFVIDLPMDAAAPGLPPRDEGPAPRAIVVSRDPLQATALARLLEAQAHAVELRVPAADPADLPATDAETLLVVDDDSEGGLLEALRRTPRAGPVILLQARAPASGTFEGEPGVALLRPPATPLRLRRAIAQCRRRVSPGAFDANADAGLRGEFSGASALLVEDHAINRRVAAHLLDYAGIDVAVATNGEEACAALLGPQARPVDIILMDVQMPGMDGLTATQKLRAAGIATPIVALTAGVSTEEREACFAAGMSDWLAKPIDTDDLAAVLTRWLPARHGAAAPGPSPQPLATTGAEARAAPGIDLEGALRRFLGRRDVFEQALGSFVRDQRPEVERIAVLLAQGQSATVARLLHGLAGGAATLGANALQDAARALENAVRSGTTDALPEAQRRLREAFGEVESLAAGGMGKPFC